jgi:hypothetical protein
VLVVYRRSVLPLTRQSLSRRSSRTISFLHKRGIASSFRRENHHRNDEAMTFF